MPKLTRIQPEYRQKRQQQQKIGKNQKLAEIGADKLRITQNNT